MTRYRKKLRKGSSKTLSKRTMKNKMFKNKMFKNKLRKNIKTRNHKMRGGIGLTFSSIKDSIVGTGQGMYDTWKGVPSHYSNVNPSPESQQTINSGEIYKSNHNIL